MQSIRILGIDPGFDRVGVCILDKNNNKEQLVYSTCLLTNKKDSFEKRLGVIGDSLEEILIKYNPKELAIEKLFFAKNQTTAINVAEARGVCLYLSHKYGLSVHEYSPPEIKLAVGGHGRSTKTDIAKMVPKILGKQVESGLLDDELDAIAIALTHSACRKIGLLK
ncbi:MAG: crossover junction endodeoxyribonuclease RuvC [Candidatus Paceibacterota bacterium]|jgi:crossover junction endodeoxyribonuclease RuvC